MYETTFSMMDYSGGRMVISKSCIVCMQTHQHSHSNTLPVFFNTNPVCISIVLLQKLLKIKKQSVFVCSYITIVLILLCLVTDQAVLTLPRQPLQE
jgi:hypothetical protein